MSETRWAFVLIAGCLLASCGWTQQQGARQTLLGVDRRQALVAVHRALNDQSFAIESVDAEAGLVTTQWRDRSRRSLRVSAKVAGREDGVEVDLTAEARDRAVKGWTEAYPSPSDARWLLRKVARRANELQPVAPPEPATEPAAPEAPAERLCQSSRECPPGQHCGSGRCVWECATDGECEGASICDRRGRCVDPPPPPPSCPEPPAAPEEEE